MIIPILLLILLGSLSASAEEKSCTDFEWYHNNGVSLVVPNEVVLNNGEVIACLGGISFKIDELICGQHSNQEGPLVVACGSISRLKPIDGAVSNDALDNWKIKFYNKRDIELINRTVEHCNELYVDKNELGVVCNNSETYLIPFQYVRRIGVINQKLQ